MVLRKVYYKLKLYKVAEFASIIASAITRKFWKPINMLTTKETIDYIVEHKCSIARYGDGELSIVAYCTPLRFQKSDKRLQKRLIQVLKTSNPNLLICVSNRLNKISDDERKKLSVYWQEALTKHLYAWTKHISKNRLYGDANISRLTDVHEYNNTVEYIEHIKKLWRNRNIILIEGALTRFGVGNDLLDDVKSIKRILGPAESAFDYYDEILTSSLSIAKEIDDPLFIIALGPTATILASDLAEHAIQALDIGHLDICYEYFKGGNATSIANKYVNEAVDGNIVTDCNDSEYISQIILRIGK